MSVQIRCGELKPTNFPDGKGFKGSVRLIGRLAGELELHLHDRRSVSENAPTYEIFFRDSVGTVYPIGSAWLKNDPRVSGGDFLSLTMGHPDWPGDLTLAAFPGDKDEMRLVYSRPRGLKVQQEAA